MEALVNVAFDRISEDIILLYDVVAAYKETPAPQADILTVMNAISCSLTRDSERAMGRAWDIDGSRGQDPGSGTAAEGEDGCSYTQSDEEGEDIELIACDKPSQLLELARDVVTSTVSDFAVMPFWAVKVSAVAHRGRLPLLWPFVGYFKAMSQILEREGLSGLFKGWMPICAAGLIRYFRRSKLLYTDYYWRTTHRVTSKFIMRSEYSRHVNDPEVMAQTYEGVVARVLWAVILHPFDLIATRMITESTPQYATMASSVGNVLKHRGVSGLFLGVRSSIFNVLLPFGKWYLMGVPFLVKTRRMLNGMDTVYRAGMGGSLDMVRDILKEDGFIGLFAGCQATLWGVGPAFLSLCTARIMVCMVMGSSARTRVRRRRRNAHLRHLMSHPQKDGKLKKARQSEGENAGHSGGNANIVGVRSASGGSDWRPYPVDARYRISSV